MKAASADAAPTSEKGTVSRGRQPNAHYRSREYLTEREVERLMKVAAGGNRYGRRDATMILMAFRHGLRASELCSLRWDQVDLGHGQERDALGASAHRDRATGATSPTTGARPAGALRIRQRAGGSDEPSRLSADDNAARQGRQNAFPDPSPHASACHWLQAGQPGRRYSCPPALPRSQEYSAHGAIYRAFPRQVPGFLERLTACTARVITFA